jgi:hypothetical protein
MSVFLAHYRHASKVGNGFRCHRTVLAQTRYTHKDPAGRQGEYCAAPLANSPKRRVCDVNTGEETVGKICVKIAHFGFVLEKVGWRFALKRLNLGRSKRDLEADSVLDTVEIEDAKEVGSVDAVLDALHNEVAKEVVPVDEVLDTDALVIVDGEDVV